MSHDGPSTAGGGDRRSEHQTPATTTAMVIGGRETRNVSNNGNGVVLPPPPLPVPYPMSSPNRLRLNPNTEHKADNYDDMELDFSPLIYSNLEKYLPPSIISSSRENKAHYMRELLVRYCPEGERNRVSNRLRKFLYFYIFIRKIFWIIKLWVFGVGITTRNGVIWIKLKKNMLGGIAFMQFIYPNFILSFPKLKQFFLL